MNDIIVQIKSIIMCDNKPQSIYNNIVTKCGKINDEKHIADCIKKNLKKEELNICFKTCLLFGETNKGWITNEFFFNTLDCSKLCYGHKLTSIEIFNLPKLPEETIS